MSGSPPNYYALLGVLRTASREQVERAFRQYVRLIHPDQFFFTDPPRHKVAQEKLKEVIAAMQVLRDPAGRARYDAMLDGLPLASRLGPPPQDIQQAQAASRAAESPLEGPYQQAATGTSSPDSGSHNALVQLFGAMARVIFRELRRSLAMRPPRGGRSRAGRSIPKRMDDTAIARPNRG